MQLLALEHAAACPLLPPEIWRIVLRSFGTQPQQLVQLWTGCRGVCRYFKYEVEQLFIVDHLPGNSLEFDITTSQAFDGNSRIEFRDQLVLTEYSYTSVDRATAFFKSKDENEAEILKMMHTGASFPRPSHLVDFSRPFNDIALPGIVFHANGEVEVGWRELFSALLAEEKFYDQIGRCPLFSEVSQALLRLALIDDETQSGERNPSGIFGEGVVRRPWMVERGFVRGAEILESNLSKAQQAETRRARVFHMVMFRAPRSIDSHSHPDWHPMVHEYAM